MAHNYTPPPPSSLYSQLFMIPVSSTHQTITSTYRPKHISGHCHVSDIALLNIQADAEPGAMDALVRRVEALVNTGELFAGDEVQVVSDGTLCRAKVRRQVAYVIIAIHTHTSIAHTRVHGHLWAKTSLQHATEALPCHRGAAHEVLPGQLKNRARTSI